VLLLTAFELFGSFEHVNSEPCTRSSCGIRVAGNAAARDAINRHSTVRYDAWPWSLVG
jgi:hypothetical protein